MGWLAKTTQHLSDMRDDGRVKAPRPRSWSAKMLELPEYRQRRIQKKYKKLKEKLELEEVREKDDEDFGR